MTQPRWARNQQRNPRVPTAGTDALSAVWRAEAAALPTTATEAAAKARDHYLDAFTIYTTAITSKARGRKARQAYERASMFMASAQWLLWEEARLRAMGRE